MKIFIGGAWPYANNSLHIGHLAALLPGDVIARYYRMKGDDVLYVSGTDAHGTPITVRAKKEKVEPSKIANHYHEEFEMCFDKLDFSYDIYTKTNDENHKKEVEKLFLKIMDNGYIYQKEELQDYCETCETFLSDREIEGICPHCGGLAKGDQCDQCLTTLNAKELKEKKCKECGNFTTEKLNKHLYFSLSSFQNEIADLVESKKSLWRLNSLNESKKYLKNGLLDRAATRQLTWGVDTPVVGYEDKKIYVWIEAVLGYLTAGKKACEEKGLNFDEFIKKSDNLRTYYAHGKDNIPFHTIIFPALLMSLKENYQLPDYIVSSEYVNMNNEKISKSKGNGVIVKDLIEEYKSDTIRYYMIANGPERKDVNFSYDDLEQNHNKHLVGEYGNFVNRNLAFLIKKFEGQTPLGIMNQQMDELIDKIYLGVGKAIEKGELKTAMELSLSLVQASNKYYDDQKPWIQVKESMEDFNNTTYTCINLIANIANIMSPFMPQSSNQIKKFLNIENNQWKKIIVDKQINLKDVKILFDRIESEKKTEQELVLGKNR
jgi:methionyl-tRNA synthetase